MRAPLKLRQGRRPRRDRLQGHQLRFVVGTRGREAISSEDQFDYAVLDRQDLCVASVPFVVSDDGRVQGSGV